MKSSDEPYISVISGQAIDMTSKGIVVKCSDGETKIEVLKSGRIRLCAKKEIQILVEEDISVFARQLVRLLGGKTIKLERELGGSLTLDEDGNITVTGIEVHMN